MWGSTWANGKKEMAIITRMGKFKTNKCGDQEPEEKTVFFKGETTRRFCHQSGLVPLSFRKTPRLN
jgi:hypothetical protein